MDETDAYVPAPIPERASVINTDGVSVRPDGYPQRSPFREDTAASLPESLAAAADATTATSGGGEMYSGEETAAVSGVHFSASAFHADASWRIEVLGIGGPTEVTVN